MSAEDAFKAGLVSRLCDKEEIDETVEEIISAIEQTSRAVQATGKLNYYSQIEKNIAEAADDMEKAMIDNLKFVDTQHGINAFLSKKKPKWTHSDEKIE